MNLPHFNILLADDDKDDCLLFKEAINELPVTSKIKIVYNGDHLMRHLLKDTELLPDVLFLDLNMPRKNGFECLEEIRQDKKFEHLPVIIFSTSYNREIVDLLQRQGAQHYIRKPNEFCKLRNVIHQALLLISQEKELQHGTAPFFI